MVRLPYRPEQFGAYMGPMFTYPSEIQFTWDELIRAAITVGRRNWSDVLRHGSYSVLEVLWRVAIVRANLVQEPDGRLSGSNAFLGLDPSERGAISYFLGLTFSKLIAEKLFGVPWLLHLDVYKKDLNPHLALNLKPDFVGMDAHNQWLVVESKGLTSPIGLGALREAKRQTRSLRNLNGQLPALRIAVGTYFSSGMTRARIMDPDDFDDDARDLQFHTEDFALAYYRPVIEAVEQLPSAAMLNADTLGRAVELAGLDARVSVDSDIHAWYRDQGPAWEEVVAARRSVPSILERIRTLRTVPESERQAILRRDLTISQMLDTRRLREPTGKGLDGVSVELGESWAERFMRREPEERGRVE